MGIGEGGSGVGGAHPEDLSVWHHGGVGAGDVKVALVELSEAAAVHLGLVPAVHLADVIPLDVADAVEGDVPCKRHREVVPARRLQQTVNGCSKRTDAATERMQKTKRRSKQTDVCSSLCETHGVWAL